MPFVENEYKIRNLRDEVDKAFSTKLNNELNNIAKNNLLVEQFVEEIFYNLESPFEVQVFISTGIRTRQLALKGSVDIKKIDVHASTIARKLVQSLNLGKEIVDYIDSERPIEYEVSTIDLFS